METDRQLNVHMRDPPWLERWVTRQKFKLKTQAHPRWKFERSSHCQANAIHQIAVILNINPNLHGPGIVGHCIGDLSRSSSAILHVSPSMQVLVVVASHKHILCIALELVYWSSDSPERGSLAQDAPIAISALNRKLKHAEVPSGSRTFLLRGRAMPS